MAVRHSYFCRRELEGSQVQASTRRLLGSQADYRKLNRSIGSLISKLRQDPEKVPGTLDRCFAEYEKVCRLLSSAKELRSSLHNAMFGNEILKEAVKRSKHGVFGYYGVDDSKKGNCLWLALLNPNEDLRVCAKIMQWVPGHGKINPAAVNNLNMGFRVAVFSAMPQEDLPRLLCDDHYSEITRDDVKKVLAGEVDLFGEGVLLRDKEGIRRYTVLSQLVSRYTAQRNNLRAVLEEIINLYVEVFSKEFSEADFVPVVVHAYVALSDGRKLYFDLECKNRNRNHTVTNIRADDGIDLTDMIKSLKVPL